MAKTAAQYSKEYKLRHPERYRENARKAEAKRKPRKLAQWNLYARTPHGQFITSKSKAKRAGHEWGLTEEQFTDARSGSCYYCGGPLPESSRGLDRLDNTKGYFVGNVVACCASCNRLKSDILTPEEAVAVVNLLKSMRNGAVWGK